MKFIAGLKRSQSTNEIRYYNIKNHKYRKKKKKSWEAVVHKIGVKL